MADTENKLIKGLIIAFASLTAMAAAYLAYALFHTVIARLTVPVLGHPYPTVVTRPVFAGIMTILYLIYYRRGRNDFVKAALISIPSGAMMLSLGIPFFRLPLLALASKSAVFLVFLLILKSQRKDWNYYLALTLTYILAAIY